MSLDRMTAPQRLYAAVSIHLAGDSARTLHSMQAVNVDQMLESLPNTPPLHNRILT